MTRALLVWAGIGIAIALPLLGVAMSPQLEWRAPVYIAASFAGVLAMALMLLQPLLAAGLLPGANGLQGRRAHRALGGGLVLLVILHVVGLWLTSPPDVIDALLFASPTPFSLWGVLAMWALFAAALLALLRRTLRLRWRLWRRLHTGLAALVVSLTVLHVFLIDGTMTTASKLVLSLLVCGALLWVMIRLRIWSRTPASPVQKAPHHG